MTSIRKLKMVLGAGEPDDVPARRIDVISAAERMYDAWSNHVNDSEGKEHWSVHEERIQDAKEALFRNVEKYRSALKRRATL